MYIVVIGLTTLLERATFRPRSSVAGTNCAEWGISQRAHRRIKATEFRGSRGSLSLPSSRSVNR